MFFSSFGLATRSFSTSQQRARSGWATIAVTGGVAGRCFLCLAATFYSPAD
jgi:hypothetical protein